MHRRVVSAALLALALFGTLTATSAAAAPGGPGGVWMSGPGCGGRYEWRQHPQFMPYFCDGIAVVEDAHWRSWGKDRATASATMNEAELNSHNNPATAPRLRSAVTLVATKIELCGNRRAYTRVVIKFHKAVNGVKQLTYPSLLPKCTRPGEAENASPASFFSPDKKVWCSYLSATKEVSCGTDPKPPTYSASLTSGGEVQLCSVPKLEYPGGDHGPPAGCYQNWPQPGDPVPVLAAGRSAAYGNIRCSAASDSVTCVKAAGAKQGHGFRVGDEEAVAVEPGAGTSSAAPTAFEFHAKTPSGGAISCAMYDHYSGPAQALCETYGPKLEAKATVFGSGRVTLCRRANPGRNACNLGNAGEGIPTLGYGSSRTVGRFRCTVRRQGVRCVVSASGKGFVFGLERQRRVG